MSKGKKKANKKAYKVFKSVKDLLPNVLEN